MPIEVVWDNETKTVLRYDIGEYWNWDDFPAAVRTAERMRAEIPHTVDLIISAHDGMRPPLGFPLSSLINCTLTSNPGAIGAAVFVGNDHFRNTMTFICRSIADNDSIQGRVFVTSALDKARAIITARQINEVDTQIARVPSKAGA